MSKKIITEIFSWSKAILFAISFSLFITVFLLQPYQVSGSSMEPTFQGIHPFDEEQVGDRVMAFKSAYLLGHEPEYGDMVILDSRIHRVRTLKDNFLDSPMVKLILTQNDSTEQFWIKRVIGKSGDTLTYKDGRVFRNGVELNEDYIKEEMIFPFETVVVPDNHVFVMGDNRNDSLDSRKVGPIPQDNIVGKVVLRFYPLNKLSIY